MLLKCIALAHTLAGVYNLYLLKISIYPAAYQYMHGLPGFSTVDSKESL